MGLFSRNKNRDVILLIPVDESDRKPPKGKTRMLYCDVEGKVYTTLIDNQVYRLILDDIDRMEKDNKDFATVGLEIGPGTFAPIVVEVTNDESWALTNILDHALKNGLIPDILRKHIKNIVQRGNIDTAKSSQANQYAKKNRTVTPTILNRLPYYLEKDMEFSMPVYKAEHQYPLIVLGYLSADHESNGNNRELLVLDNDGDLAVIKVPFKLLNNALKKLNSWAEYNSRDACLIISREHNSYSINFIVISPAQRRSLDTMARNFEENGTTTQTVSVAAQRVIGRARESVSSITE